MNKLLRLTHPLFKIFNNSLIDLPAPINISMLWNFGSLLGICLMTQIITGLFLTMHYTPNIEMAFNSINHIMQDVNYGWLIRTIHANGASFFFFFMYIHIGRGLYYNSFYMKMTWMMGVTIFFCTMAAAFLGYVLPWGQMSFWGATVITNLMSAIPYMGDTLVQWIWGGFAVGNATLSRFFTFHFILPLIILLLMVIHLLFLHQTGSHNPLGINSTTNKIAFHPYYTFKDLITLILMFNLLMILVLIAPYYLGDSDNFIPANPLVTPLHIQPEWYFLFAYAILRSIPNKLGGVIALFMSISILYLLPLFINQVTTTQFSPLNKLFFWNLTMKISMLTWIGMCPVESPFIEMGQSMTIFYFSYYLSSPFIMHYWTKKLY